MNATTPTPDAVKIRELYDSRAKVMVERDNLRCQVAELRYALESMIATFCGDSLKTEAETEARKALRRSEAGSGLISSTPELLAALKLTLDRATLPGFLRDQIKAAIAEAEGGAL